MKVKNTPRRLISSNEQSDNESDAPDTSLSSSSEEESFTTEILTSPYEPTDYTSFSSHTDGDALQPDIDLLQNKSISNFTVKTKIPYHVTKSATFVVDISTFENKNDITVDCWRWDLNKTYVSSTPSIEGYIVTVKGNDIESYSIVKRKYICKQNKHFKKQILAIYHPGKTCTSRQGPFNEAEQLILVKYRYPAGNSSAIPPSPNPRTYPSVKSKLQGKIQKGESVKKATFLTETEMGGLENVPNSSFLPSRNQARYIKNKEKKSETVPDPLQMLIEKQHSDPFKFIRKIETAAHSFSIFLMAETQLQNIANFCTTENGKWKSELSWDFTFKLGNFDVLVLTYRNTSLVCKRTGRAPSMLGGLLVCHQRTKDVVKIACDALVSLVPGLKIHLQVNVCDGEKSIINNVCDTFPGSVLLICTRHVEGNIRDHLPTVPQVQKNQIISDIFDDSGIVGSTDFEEFSERTNMAIERWRSDYDDASLQKFIDYFEKNKVNEIKFHLMKGVVNAADLCGKPDKVYNNNLESLNNVMKKWQGNQQVDIYKFVTDIEELIKCQDSEVLRAFTNKSGNAANSTYTVHPDFQDYTVDFDLGYASLSVQEKAKKRSKFLNWLVDPAKYKEVISYKPGAAAREKVRENISALLASRERIEVEEEENIDTETEQNVTLISSALPHLHIDVIRDIVNKATDIRETGKIMQAGSNEWWVKSSSSPTLHVVGKKLSGAIVCDTSCQGYKMRSVCAHTIAVALQSAIDLQNYASHLSTVSPSLTKSASSLVRQDAGKKPRSTPAKRSSNSPGTTRKKRGPHTSVASPSKLNIPIRTFCLKVLRGNISTCYGCMQPIVRILSEEEFVIVYRDDRFMYGSAILEKLQNVHFHLDPLCIQIKYPDFNSEIMVPSDMHLTQSQVQCIETKFKLYYV